MAETRSDIQRLDTDKANDSVVVKRIAKTSDQTMNSNTTPADISDLTVSIAANEVIHFHAYLINSSSATFIGVQFSINGPSSPTQVTALIRNWQGANNQTLTNINAYETYTSEANSAGTTRQVTEIVGVVINGSNAGTFALRVRSEVDGNDVTVYRGSYMNYWIGSN